MADVCYISTLIFDIHSNYFHQYRMGEILPAKIRGSAASVATAFNWTCTFVVTKTFIDMIGKLLNSKKDKTINN